MSRFWRELSDFPQEAAEALVATAGPQVDIPVVMTEIRQLGGALGRAPQSPNATGNRDARFQVFAGTAGPHRQAYEPEAWERLRRIKAAYDPRNLFRHNHNIAAG